MAISRKTSKDTTALAISGELTIYTVAQVKDEFLSEPLPSTAKVNLDLHQLAELDTAGVQLLLFINKLISEASIEVAIGKTNELVDAVFALLDIHSHFAKEH